jgi:hypothetical protein
MMQSAPSAPNRKKKIVPVLLFGIGIAFWPLFAGLIALEERSGFTWIRTESATVWFPIAAAALISAAVAPLFTDMKLGKKVTSVVLAALAYIAAYGLVALVGVRHLGWDD